MSISDTVETSIQRLVMPVLRHLLWLAICITAVAAHHLWFDIGKRGLLQAVLDGVFLATSTMVVVWIHGTLISKHNSGVRCHSDTMTKTKI